MRFIIGLILLSFFLLVAYPLREIIFFTGDVAAKDSGTWQEIYNALVGCVLIYIHVKGFVLLFKPVNYVSPFRAIMGIILLAVFGFLVFNKSLQELLFFRSPEYFPEAAINASWAFIAIYSLLKGFYCVYAGNRHLPGFDNGEWRVTWKGYIAECSSSKLSSDVCVNKNIQSVVEYRNSKIGMMTNENALVELGNSAGIEMYLNDNSSHAKYLDSQLSMKTNEEGLKYVQNLFGNKK